MSKISELKAKINSIPEEYKQIIDLRISEFSSFNQKTNEDWFSELCFCLLTANSKAQTAINIQKTLGYDGFTKLSQENLARTIREHKHRFHNNKAKYIIQARQNKNIKEIIQSIVKKENEFKAREWLVQNINGLGYKEASHFLRNTGHKSLAILDRHILNILADNNIIEKPKSLNKKIYLDNEKIFQNLASSLETTPAKLDLQLWYLQTGRVLK
ncbi:MAG: N-glycosylase/DNA lyase [Nanoarchaeota archaeon]